MGTAWPRTADKIDITIKDANAAVNTTTRGCFIAMRAAMRNVLSPISENRIMIKERVKECHGELIVPDISSSSSSLNFSGGPRVSSSSSSCLSS